MVQASNRVLCSLQKLVAAEMAKQVKTLVAKPDDLSLISGPHMVERKL